MALLDKPIEVAFVADDSQIQQVMARVGRQTEAMGGKIKSSSETGRLGMWSLGESAENMAQSLGVPNQMSRQLGNSVERLSASMGRAAIALGVVGLAAMAAYAIWQHLAEAKQKAHEELEKSVDAMLKEETALYKNKVVTTDLAEANDRLRDIRKKILDQDFAKWAQQEREEIEKLNEKIKEGGEWYQRLWDIFLRGGASDLETLEETAAQEQARRNERVKSLVLEREKMQTELAQKQAQRRANELSEQETYLNELNDMEKKRYLDSDKIMQKQREQEYADYLRRIQLAKQEQEAKITMARMTATNLSQIGMIMASMGGKNARKWFSLQKTASIAEAIINTYTGATKAMAQGGIYGAVLAASVIALGMAQVAKIRSQTFEGGGGSGAVGTFAANPVTGLPTGGSAVNLTLVVNGQTANIGDIAAGTLQELYRNNGSLGGLTVSVERSA